MGRWPTNLGLMLDFILICWVGSAWALDQVGAWTPAADQVYDAVVVAGAGVRPGGVPSEALWKRTRRGVSLWQQGRAPRLALTGGIGDWPPAESVVARRLAVEWGVPDSVLILEAGSRNTEENAAGLFELVGDVRLLVVTDRFHAFRCRRVFGRYFSRVDTVGVLSSPWVRTHGAMREVLAVAGYGLAGRLGGAPPSVRPTPIRR